MRLLKGLSTDDRRLFLALADGLRGATSLAVKLGAEPAETNAYIDLLKTAKARLQGEHALVDVKGRKLDG